MTEVIVVDVELANEIGLHEAVFVAYLAQWIRSNRKHGRHLHDDRTWTYGTYDDLAESLPFFTYKQVRTTIATLVEKGILIKGNFNRNKHDRTTWYAFDDETLFVKPVPRKSGFGHDLEPSEAEADALQGNSNKEELQKDKQTDKQQGVTPPNPSEPKGPSYFLGLMSEKMQADTSLVDSWKVFVRFRARRKKTVIDEDQAKRLIKRLHKHRDPTGLLDLSIENGWQGLIEDAYDKAYGNNGIRQRPQQNGKREQSHHEERIRNQSSGTNFDEYREHAEASRKGYTASG